MQIDDFADILRRHGISHGAGVPCSFFTPLVNHMMVDPELDYTSATSEGEAVAIAAGLTTAGKPAFALMQNSGLGNAVNPITSMLYIYSIPVTLLVSHRGEPGKPDEPQHALMGRITEALSELCGLRTNVLDPARFADQLGAALGDSVPAAFICRKGTLKGGPEAPDLDLRFTTRATAPANTGTFRAELRREQALDAAREVLNRGLEGTGQSDGVIPAVICTTGKLSRELYELDDTDFSKKKPLLHGRFHGLCSRLRPRRRPRPALAPRNRARRRWRAADEAGHARYNRIDRALELPPRGIRQRRARLYRRSAHRFTCG